MEKVPSKAYPNIEYTPGDDLWVGDFVTTAGAEIYFDMDGRVTGDRNAVQHVANALERLEELERKARAYMLDAIRDAEHRSHDMLEYFFECQTEELDKESVCAMLQTEEPAALSREELLDKLRMRRLGSYFDKEKGQVFVLDFSFDPEYTDELAVVYCDTTLNPIMMSHES